MVVAFVFAAATKEQPEEALHRSRRPSYDLASGPE